MRLYSFTNSNFIKEIQNGIQTAHIVSRMFVREPAGKARKKLIEWADKHETIIILKGGNHLELETLHQSLLILAGKLKLPVEIFYEDATQNHLCTAVGIVVPESIYNMIPVDPASEILTDEEQLYLLIKSKSLA